MPSLGATFVPLAKHLLRQGRRGSTCPIAREDSGEWTGFVPPVRSLEWGGESAEHDDPFRGGRDGTELAQLYLGGVASAF
jgi:hypothetical protein